MHADNQGNDMLNQVGPWSGDDEDAARTKGVARRGCISARRTLLAPSKTHEIDKNCNV